MNNKIENSQIVQNQDGLSLSFKTRSLAQSDSTNEVFEILKQGGDVEKRTDSQNIDWYYFSQEKLACRFINGTIVIQEVLDNEKATKGSSLLLVPILMLDKELISEEQKNIFWERINVDPLVKTSKISASQEEFNTILANSSDNFYGKKSRT